MAERFQKDGAQGFHSGGPEPHHQYQEYHQPSSCRKHNEEKQQPNNKNKTKPKTSHFLANNITQILRTHNAHQRIPSIQEQNVISISY